MFVTILRSTYKINALKSSATRMANILYMYVKLFESISRLHILMICTFRFQDFRSSNNFEFKQFKMIMFFYDDFNTI